MLHCVNVIVAYFAVQKKWDRLPPKRKQCPVLFDFWTMPVVVERLYFSLGVHLDALLKVNGSSDFDLDEEWILSSIGCTVMKKRLEASLYLGKNGWRREKCNVSRGKKCSLLCGAALKKFKQCWLSVLGKYLRGCQNRSEYSVFYVSGYNYSRILAVKMITKVWIMQSPAIPVNCWIILLIDFSVCSRAAHWDFSTETALEYCISKQVKAKVCRSKDNISH